MNSHVVIGIALVIGPIVAVAFIGIGLFGYDPAVATKIRAAEAEGPVVVQEIRHVHIAKPDKFRRGRIDRHPWYLGIHGATWCYSWCIFSGAPITSNLAALSEQERLTMALCFLIGSSLVISGALMGAQVGRFRIYARVHDNITSAKLGDDIRLPYTFGVIGMSVTAISMGLYASTSFASTTGSLGGWITAWGAGVALVMLAMFVTRIRRYSRTQPVIIAEAVRDIVERHADD